MICSKLTNKKQELIGGRCWPSPLLAVALLAVGFFSSTQQQREGAGLPQGNRHHHYRTDGQTQSRNK